MSLSSIMRAEKALLLPTYDRHAVLFRRGRGVYLYDDRGRRYLDFLSGIGVNALGYGYPAIRKALLEQARRLVHTSNLFFHDYQAELAKRLTRMSGLDRAFFCNSGTEAWEGALKLARSHARSHRGNGPPPRWRILAMENSFHGRTFASLATTGQAKYRTPFAPLVPGVRFVRFNDVADLERKFDDSVCAIGLETIQGEGGIRPVTPEFLAKARALTKKSGALLILDEIQCGLGRTGDYFAFQRYRIQPDIVTLAKPLAAGLPLGATLTRASVARSFHPGMHGTTFGGGPLTCAVAIKFLETLGGEGLLAHVRETGDYLRARLEELGRKHTCIREVRGVGLMLAAELESAELAKNLVGQMLSRGVIINRTCDTVLRFLPPYIVGPNHVDVLISRLDSVLSSVRKSRAYRSRRGSQ